MSSLPPLDILRIFLKHHNAHNNYVNNRDGSALFFLDYPDSMTYQMLDQCGFDWGKSPEGTFYWNQLNKKWIDLCKEFNLTTKRVVS